MIFSYKFCSMYGWLIKDLNGLQSIEKVRTFGYLVYEIGFLKSKYGWFIEKRQKDWASGRFLHLSFAIASKNLILFSG